MIITNAVALVVTVFLGSLFFLSVDLRAADGVFRTVISVIFMLSVLAVIIIPFYIYYLLKEEKVLIEYLEACRDLEEESIDERR